MAQAACCLACQCTPKAFKIQQVYLRKTLMQITYVILFVLLLIVTLFAVYAYYELHSPLFLFRASQRPQDTLWNKLVTANFSALSLKRHHPKKKHPVPSSLLHRAFRCSFPKTFMSTSMSKSISAPEISCEKTEKEKNESPPSTPNANKNQAEEDELPTYEELSVLVQKHLSDQRKNFKEDDFRLFVQDCAKLYPSDNLKMIENDEKRLEHCIRQNIEHWSYFNQFKLKMAIDRFKPKFIQWLQ